MKSGRQLLVTAAVHYITSIQLVKLKKKQHPQLLNLWKLIHFWRRSHRSQLPSWLLSTTSSSYNVSVRSDLRSSRRTQSQRMSHVYFDITSKAAAHVPVIWRRAGSRTHFVRVRWQKPCDALQQNTVTGHLLSFVAANLIFSNGSGLNRITRSAQESFEEQFLSPERGGGGFKYCWFRYKML